MSDDVIDQKGPTNFLLHLRKAVVERVAGAAHGADRILLAAGIEQLAQAADMHVDGALVDIDVAAPDAVQQFLARERAAGMPRKKSSRRYSVGPRSIGRPERATRRFSRSSSMSP